MPQRKNLYVDNSRLHTELTAWITARKEALAADQPIPQLPEYVAESILKISQNLAKRPNFASYTMIEDMISEGCLACIRYLHNYNPQKTHNAFAYITQIIYRVFLRMIRDMQKKSYHSMFISENLECSHENYTRQQRKVNQDHEGYQEWRQRVSKIVTRKKIRKVSRKKKATETNKSVTVAPNVYFRRQRYLVSIGRRYYGSRKTLEEALQLAQNARDGKIKPPEVRKKRALVALAAA